ncbi:NepR family anti-sigma factor [Rhodoblastus sp.]|uniref:NepR family anti-sigma factor n=1 Tax=Rhodoblastus sp. TaxID=1962975 RepID=UPI003F9E1889
MNESGKDKKTVEPTLEPLLQAHIGKQLKEMYSATAREPVPDRFKLLLDRLEANEPPETVTEAADDEAGAK